MCTVWERAAYCHLQKEWRSSHGGISLHSAACYCSLTSEYVKCICNLLISIDWF